MKKIMIMLMVVGSLLSCKKENVTPGIVTTLKINKNYIVHQIDASHYEIVVGVNGPNQILNAQISFNGNDFKSLPYNDKGNQYTNYTYGNISDTNLIQIDTQDKQEIHLYFTNPVISVFATTPVDVKIEY